MVRTPTTFPRKSRVKRATIDEAKAAAADARPGGGTNLGRSHAVAFLLSAAKQLEDTDLRPAPGDVYGSIEALCEAKEDVDRAQEWLGEVIAKLVDEAPPEAV